jgi:hypothetical protein
MAAFACSIGPDTPTKGGSRIKCEACLKTSKSWGAIVKHYMSAHAVPEHEMHGHYIWEQAQLQQILKKGAEVTDEEYEVLKPCDDENMFVCKLCDKAYSKRSLSPTSRSSTPSTRASPSIGLS